MNKQLRFDRDIYNGLEDKVFYSIKPGWALSLLENDDEAR